MSTPRSVPPWRKLPPHACDDGCGKQATVQVGEEPPRVEDMTKQELLLQAIFSEYEPLPVRLLCAGHAEMEADRRLEDRGSCTSFVLQDGWRKWLRWRAERVLPLYRYPEHEWFAGGPPMFVKWHYAVRWHWVRRLVRTDHRYEW